MLLIDVREVEGVWMEVDVGVRHSPTALAWSELVPSMIEGFGEELDNIVFPRIIDLAAGHKALEPRHELKRQLDQ